MLSVIIPARNEIYLEKTINDILSNAEGEIEIIVELDGYVPDPQIITDKRVTFIYHKENIGQRQCVNHGVSIAKGKYIMKLDAHCSVDKGFDVKLAADCEPNWTVVPRMYNLDVERWKPKLHKLTDYMFISNAVGKVLRAEYYTGNEYRRQHAKLDLIDDTMCCMGPGWFMYKDRFLELGGMDEKHGGWGQMGVEVACKAWLSGGALKVNKKTWFAHYFRGGIGFPYHLSGKAVEGARAYSRDLWLKNKWEKATRKFEWMIEKFNPPTWEKNVKDIPGVMYWANTRVTKYPSDLVMYEQVLFDKKPDILIECGTDLGGSALFFAHIFDIIGKGEVITIDKNDLPRPKHSRIRQIVGRTTATDTLLKIQEMVKGKTVMVVLDSDHTRVHVKRELHFYSPMVSVGQYLVVEDIHSWWLSRSTRVYEDGPGPAVEWFLNTHKNFIRTEVDKQFGDPIMTRDGWLIRQ